MPLIKIYQVPILLQTKSINFIFHTLQNRTIQFELQNYTNNTILQIFLIYLSK
jgi:hypothetical protein